MNRTALILLACLCGAVLFLGGLILVIALGRKGPTLVPAVPLGGWSTPMSSAAVGDTVSVEGVLDSGGNGDWQLHQMAVGLGEKVGPYKGDMRYALIVKCRGDVDATCMFDDGPEVPAHLRPGDRLLITGRLAIELPGFVMLEHCRLVRQSRR